MAPFYTDTRRTVIPFPRPSTPAAAAPDPGAVWRDLTRKMVLAKAERGQLEPALVAYLLDAAGVRA